MDYIQILGYIGCFLSSITFIPQVIQVYQTKSAKGLSMKMLLIIITSTIVWTIHGFGIKSWPVVACNLIIFCLSSWLAFFKWKQERKQG